MIQLVNVCLFALQLLPTLGIYRLEDAFKNALVNSTNLSITLLGDVWLPVLLEFLLLPILWICTPIIRPGAVLVCAPSLKIFITLSTLPILQSEYAF